MLLLLGPGQNLLDYRRKIKNELVRKYGYNRRDIIIMEDIRSKRYDIGIDEKFERILKYYDPMLVVALFHRKARMDGVIFEIGCLCDLYGTRNIGHRLRFLTDLDTISKQRHLILQRFSQRSVTFHLMS